MVTHTSTSSTLGAGDNQKKKEKIRFQLPCVFYKPNIILSDSDVPNILPQVQPCEDDLSNDQRKRVWKNVFLVLVRGIRCRRHDQPEDLQVRSLSLRMIMRLFTMI